MAITYLKKSPKTSSTDDTKTTGIVQDLLKDLETSKEQGCIDLTKKFDKYDGEIVVSKERIEEIKKTLDQKTKDDIQFSFDRVRKFAEAQLKNYGQDFEVELSDGLYAGQKLSTSKHRWMLYPRWKICSHCFSCDECNYS
jgi:sulfopropanediol 3-dehydrogenase